MPWPLFFIYLACFWLISCLRIVAEDERVLVFKSGEYRKMLGPGVHFVGTFGTQIARVKLTGLVESWQSLTEDEIEKAVKAIVVERNRS